MVSITGLHRHPYISHVNYWEHWGDFCSNIFWITCWGCSNLNKFTVTGILVCQKLWLSTKSSVYVHWLKNDMTLLGNETFGSFLKINQIGKLKSLRSSNLNNLTDIGILIYQNVVLDTQNHLSKSIGWKVMQLCMKNLNLAAIWDLNTLVILQILIFWFQWSSHA